MNIANKFNGAREIWPFDNRWQLLANRLLFSRTALSTYRWGDLNILVDHAAGDANGTREVFATPMYRRLLELMDLDRPLRILDIGAHTGSFTLLLASMKHKIDMAACIEMNPQTFQRLQFNIRTNLDCEVALVECAVDGDGTNRTVLLGAGGTGDSLELGAAQTTGAKEVVVECRTLDDIVATIFGTATFDICKIDVEAAEYEIFGKPHHLAIRQSRYVIIEIHNHPEHRPNEVVTQLERIGFTALAPQTSAEGVYLFRNTTLA